MTEQDKENVRNALTNLHEQLVQEFANHPDTEATNEALTRRTQEITRSWGGFEIGRVIRTRSDADGRPMLTFEFRWTYGVADRP
jgi:hypothetical protein